MLLPCARSPISGRPSFVVDRSPQVFPSLRTVCAKRASRAISLSVDFSSVHQLLGATVSLVWTTFQLTLLSIALFCTSRFERVEKCLSISFLLRLISPSRSDTPLFAAGPVNAPASQSLALL